MAEETLYDEQMVTDEGDPKDPLGLRKKLSATKEKPDPLGLRAKLKPVQAAPVTHEQALALPKIDYSKPVFQENVSESTAIPQGATQALLATPPKETVAEKFENKVKQSRDKIFSEITTNDKAIENLIRKQKFEEAGRNVELPTSDMPVQGALAQDVARMIQPQMRHQDMPVTPEDLQEKKALVANDDSQARRLLEEVVRVDPSKKKEVQKSIYDLDIANAIQNDPEGQANVRKVLDNSKKIENGELIYDFRNGNLIKPLNAFQSALQGWKEGSRIRDEFSIFNKMNDGQLATMLDAQMATNQGKSKYDPIEAPEGLVGDMLKGLAMSPATTAGGTAGSLVGPEGAIAAGSILGAGEQAQRDYVLTLKRIYSELRANGADQLDAIKEAKRQALHAGGVGAIEGAAFGFIGAKLGAKPLPTAALTSGFRNAVVNSLKSAGKTISTATKEGLAAGGIMAAGERYKNSLAKEAGIDRDIDDGVAESIESNLLFTLGMAGAIKAMKVGGKAYKSLISGLSKAEDAKISGSITEMLQNKEITEAQAAKLQEDINTFRTEDATIPENVAPEARMAILEKIKKRNELEQKMESTDKAFHPEIKEKIEAIEEEITGLSKETVKPEKTDKELHGLIDEAMDEGKLEGIMSDVAKKDPEGFMKFVADQALGRTETGEMSELGSAEYAVRDQYGDAIVDKALEMFPLEKPKESSISVIRPEERTQPTETITIKPSENGTLPIGISEKVPLGETPGHSGEMDAGASSPEESTGTQARTNKEGKTQDQEKVSKIFVEHPPTELSHRGLQEVANEFSLDDVKSRDRKTDIQLRKDAENQINDWNKEGKYPQNVERLTVKAEEGEVLTDKERVIMEQHLATVRDRLRGLDKQSPEYKKGLQYLQRLKDAGERTRSEAGAALRLPTFRSNPLKDVEDAYLAKMEAAGVNELTPKQMEEVDAQVGKFQTAEIKAEVKTAELEAKVNEAKADTEFKKVKKQVARKKKTAEEYKADRAATFEAAREALKKLRTGESGLSAVPLPGIRELAAIAPHVKDLLVSLAEQGVTELADAVKQLHEGFKDILEGITEKDIHNIIAGEYNEPRKPLSVLQQTLRDLRDEAKLINDLERLEAGMPPKAEKAKIQRNQKIKALRDKINEFKKAKKAEESGGEAFHGEELDETAKKLNAIKKRNEKAQQDIKRKIENKEFDGPGKRTSLLEDPEVKKNYPQLRKEALDAIVEKENAQHEFELALLKDEMSKRNKGEKLRDFGKKLIATSKAILSGIDDSATFVQNHFTILSNPKAGGKAWLDHVKDAISEPRMQRELAALHNSPSWDLIKNSGLDVLEPKSMAEGKIEEAFENNLLAKKIKIGDKEYDPWRYTGGIFERAFTSLGNNLRVNLFLKRAQQLMDQGKTFETHPEEFKSVARAINELTARGKQNKYIEQANPVLTPIIWAPRMLSSTFNQLGLADLLSAVGGKKLGTEGFYRKLTPDQRIYAIGQLGKNIGVGIAAMAAASFAGAEVDYDPRSVTFGNIKAGTKSYNVFGRYATVIKTIVQATLGTRIKPGGEEQDLDSGKFGAKTRGGVIGGFFRGKMTPAAGAAFDLMEGKNFYTNQPFTVKDLPQALLEPMSVKELITGWQQDGSISLLTRFLPSFEGLKVSDERDFQKETSTKSNKKKGSNKSRHSGRKTPQKH